MPARGQFQARVVESHLICDEHYRLTVALTTFADTRAGQFVQLECADGGWDTDAVYEGEWRVGQPNAGYRSGDLQAQAAVLRRPFSMAGRRDLADGTVELTFIHRVVGLGTAWLAKLRSGDAIGLLGPLGNQFQLPAAGQTALLVGGGVGIPPMLYLADDVTRQGRQAIFFAGALRKTLLPLGIEDMAERGGKGDDVEPRQVISELIQAGIPAVISSDDGSYGFRGYITQALERYLTLRRLEPGFDPIIYTCGPEPMMKRVAEIGARFGIPVQVAVERAMACGMGTCQSCCIRVKKNNPAAPPLVGQPWAYRLTCTDGPVFPAEKLLW